jgi:hypothetical protein
MKHLFIILLILIVVLISSLLQSCCTGEACPSALDIEFIHFIDFQLSEIDTIEIRKYERNSNYNVFLDSIIYYDNDIYGSPDYFYELIPGNLSIDFDYIIILNSTNQEYSISDFKTDKIKCDKGFLCSYDYNTIVSYKINEQKRYLYFIEVINDK